MDFRIKLAVFLVGAGLILAFLPAQKPLMFKVKPAELLAIYRQEGNSFSVDQVAKFVNDEDTTIRLIDVRTPHEYRECTIPGSINIPLADLLNPDWQGYLNQEKVRNILFSNSDEKAGFAWSVVTGLGYKNNFVMAGGMNEWFRTVMLSEFSGGAITPRENVLYENRYRARRTFTQTNSLPDSLKFRFLEAKRLKEANLDGGCE
jgi:rhodanese-related sulfurtransferase